MSFFSIVVNECSFAGFQIESLNLFFHRNKNDTFKLKKVFKSIYFFFFRISFICVIMTIFHCFLKSISYKLSLYFNFFGELNQI